LLVRAAFSLFVLFLFLPSVTKLLVRFFCSDHTAKNVILAQALFRSKSLTLAGWRTGSKGIVGLKMAK
jgi:hypothetical protein